MAIPMINEVLLYPIDEFLIKKLQSLTDFNMPHAT